MLNDLSIPSDDFEGDMLKHANDTNVSEYISIMKSLQVPYKILQSLL